jgi:hypothetical protein
VGLALGVLGHGWVPPEVDNENDDKKAELTGAAFPPSPPPHRPDARSGFAEGEARGPSFNHLLFKSRVAPRTIRRRDTGNRSRSPDKWMLTQHARRNQALMQVKQGFFVAADVADL